MITSAVPFVQAETGPYIFTETLLPHDRNPNTLVIACTSTETSNTARMAIPSTYRVGQAPCCHCDGSNTHADRNPRRIILV